VKSNALYILNYRKFYLSIAYAVNRLLITSVQRRLIMYSTVSRACNKFL